MSRAEQSHMGSGRGSGTQRLSSLPPPSPWGLPLWVQVKELVEDLALEEVVRYPSADVPQIAQEKK